MTAKTQHHISGSVFFLIFLAIALFAAVSYAILQGGRVGSASLTREQTRLAVMEIVFYTDSLAKSVHKLRLKGCTDTQINFNNSIIPGYSNPLAPSDGSCDVFGINGGGMTMQLPKTEWLDRAESAKPGFGLYFFPYSSCIPGVGSAGSCFAASTTDLMVIIPWLSRQVCEGLNQHFHSNNLTYFEAGAAFDPSHKFVGTYTLAWDIDTWDNRFSNKSQYCFRGALAQPEGGYHFYQVLIAR